MSNFIIDHAIDNVSCSRFQDKQYVIKAKLITKPTGVLNRIQVLGRFLTLPEQGVRYHVYQIGKLPPNKLGLISKDFSWTIERWYGLEESINQRDLIANLYIDEGMELPKFRTSYIYTTEGDLLIAIQEDPNFNISYYDTIYLRVYSNAYFESVRSTVGSEITYCKGTVPTNTQDILALQLEYNNYASRDGHVFAYVNGYKVETLDIYTVQPHDTVEFIYDSSVKKVVNLSISDLDTFNSVLDSRFKYLLHYPDDTAGSVVGDIIDYQDDIDIHVVYKYFNNRYKGVYYHRNVEDSHRMVTHRDYSVPVDFVTNTANALNDTYFNSAVNIANMELEIKIRDSGFDRPLIYDSNRLFELYKLSDSEVVESLVGGLAGIAEWKAENLELSAYTKLMGEPVTQIDINTVVDAYGYNSLSKIIATTPVKLVQGGGVYTGELSRAFHDSCTVYELDSLGKLVNVVRKTNSHIHQAVDSRTRSIEVIAGAGTTSPELIFGEDNLVLPTSGEYRVYRSFLSNGVSDENWVDITDSGRYLIQNGVLVWDSSDVNQYLMVRTDRSFLSYNLDIPTVEGCLFFTISEYEDRGNGVQEYILPVVLGQLDIWLNGSALIEGLDYIVRDSLVYILNKKYLVQPSATELQHIYVRYLGFANINGVRDPVDDYGFIEHGFLSNNHKHDIRDDKVLRITVDGSTIDRSDIVFSEQHSGISINNASNGLPYQIKDIIVPLTSILDRSYYDLRDASLELDGRVRDYMSLKLPEPDRGNLMSIPAKYHLVSPFFCTIIADLEADILDSAGIAGLVTDVDIANYVATYEDLLYFDPIGPDNTFDFKYVSVDLTMYNTTVNLSPDKYVFLQDLIRLYGKNLLNITQFITLTI